MDSVARGPAAEAAAPDGLTTSSFLSGPNTAAHGGGEIYQAELANLHFVPSRQRNRIDAFAIDVRAIERTDVMHRIAAAFPTKLGMPARHGYIVQKDVTVRVPSGGDRVLVEKESTAGIGSSLHHQQGRARSKRVDRTLMSFGGEFPVGFRHRDMGPDNTGGVRQTVRQHGAAVCAVAATRRILRATSSTEHSR
jgi:hypothetical protein